MQADPAGIRPPRRCGLEVDFVRGRRAPRWSTMSVYHVLPATVTLVGEKDVLDTIDSHRAGHPVPAGSLAALPEPDLQHHRARRVRTLAENVSPRHRDHRGHGGHGAQLSP